MRVHIKKLMQGPPDIILQYFLFALCLYACTDIGEREMATPKTTRTARVTT